MLNVSGNAITNLESFALMRNLTTLNARRNSVEDFGEVCLLYRGLRYLRSLDMRDNPCCSIPKYKEKTIMLSPANLGAALCTCFGVGGVFPHSYPLFSFFGTQNSWTTAPLTPSSANFCCGWKCANAKAAAAGPAAAAAVAEVAPAQEAVAAAAA